MNDPIVTLTFAIIVGTCLCSFKAFRDPAFEERMIFSVREVLALKQYYRTVSSALLHANWSHLSLNMVSLYLFGTAIERVYGPGQFFLLYLSGVAGSALSLFIHRHHEYRALGASGGVCGLIFSYIFLLPGGSISMFPMAGFPIPIFMPAWLYAILFLVGSFFALKRQADNIGHDAHIGGAIVGLAVATALHPQIVRWSPRLFPAICLLAIGLLIYLVKNPMMLPVTSFRPWFSRKSKAPSDTLPSYRRESANVDALLEKISIHGIHSLSDRERQLLDSISAKYRRRAQSEKPESGLII